MATLNKKEIDIQKLKKILEDPESPVTPSFMLEVIETLIGLGGDEDKTEIDYIWFQMENKYNINIARKDTLSASVAFYHNPVEFFSNPNVFDKMSVAFNGHNVVTSIINEPAPEEATFAVAEAKEILKNLWEHKYADSYPLFPDVAKYVAAIYSHHGLIVFHPTLYKYQEVLNSFDCSPELNETRKEIIAAYKEYEKNPKSAINRMMLNKDIHDDFVASNLSYLIAIDLYVDTMVKYSQSLLLKIKK